MFDPTTASIIIAVIGLIAAVWSAYISNRNQKATRDITSVLSNTKTPVDSLDQVVRLLQEELNRTNKAHEEERAYFNEEIKRIRAEHKVDRDEWEAAEFKLNATIDKLVKERGDLLSEIGDLKNKLTTLEDQVRASLRGVKELDEI